MQLILDLPAIGITKPLKKTEFMAFSARPNREQIATM
jgi:hypothetical protein